MWNSSHHYNLFQQGHGNLKDREGSEFYQESEVSQASHGTEPFQEETENSEPWSRHETQLNALINQYEENWDSNWTWLVLKPKTLFFPFTEKSSEKYS